MSDFGCIRTRSEPVHGRTRDHARGREVATTRVRAQVIKKVGPYIENPDFTPKAIEKASVACKAICMCDLGVLRCCGAFTPSTRLVAISQ